MNILFNRNNFHRKAYLFIGILVVGKKSNFYPWSRIKKLLIFNIFSPNFYLLYNQHLTSSVALPSSSGIGLCYTNTRKWY